LEVDTDRSRLLANRVGNFLQLISCPPTVLATFRDSFFKIVRRDDDLALTAARWLDG
jgi:hypothetical protein